MQSLKEEISIVSVSRSTYLKKLQENDFLWCANIKADWESIHKDCEDLAENNQDHWRPDMGEDYTPWDEAGVKFKKYWDSFGDYGLAPSNKFQGYNKHNTRHWESTANKPTLTSPWMDEVMEQLPLTHKGCRIMMQPPGNTMPWHVDNFWNLRHNHPDIGEYAIRYIVFPKDWDHGHLLQAGTTFITHWKAGDVIVWHPDKWHLSANVGISNKWTFNVTGILTEEVTE